MSYIGSYSLSIGLQHKNEDGVAMKEATPSHFYKRALEAHLWALDGGKMEEKGKERENRSREKPKKKKKEKGIFGNFCT